jgi:hypothetical protein
MDTGIGGIASIASLPIPPPPTSLSVLKTINIPLDVDSVLILHYPLCGDILNYANYDSTAGVVYGVLDASLNGALISLSTNQSVLGNYSLYQSTNNSNSYLKLPTIASNTSGYSFSFWVYLTSSTNGLVWSFNGSTRIFFYYVSNSLSIASGFTTLLNCYTPSLNTWYHVAWTITTGSVSNVYINGTNVVSNSSTVPYISNSFTSSYLFGDPTGGVSAQGYLSDFRYYNRILDSAEVSQLYNIRIYPFSLNYDLSLCLYYPFDVSKNSVSNYAATIYGTVDASFVNGAYVNYSQKKIGSGSLYLPTYGYVNLNSNSVVNTTNFVSTNGMTFACWFYSINNSDYARMFDFGNGSSIYNIYICILTNSVGIGVSNGGNTVRKINSTNYNNSVWHHVVWTMTYSAGQTSIWNAYIDSSLCYTGTGDYYPPQVARTSNFLGRSNWVADPSYNGYIDDFRVYQRVLTQAEVTSLYNYMGTLTSNSAILSWVKPSTSFNLNYNCYFTDTSASYSNSIINTTKTNTVFNKLYNGDAFTYYVNSKYLFKSSAYTSISNSLYYVNDPTLSVVQDASVSLVNPNFSVNTFSGDFSAVTIITGWTLVNNSNTTFYLNDLISPFIPNSNSNLPSSINRFLAIQSGTSTSNGFFYQNVNLSTNKTYMLSFYTCARTNYYSSNYAFTVDICGSATKVNLAANIVVSQADWIKLSYPFTVPSTSSYSVKFTFPYTIASNHDYAINIANVNLVVKDSAHLSWTAPTTNGNIVSYYYSYDNANTFYSTNSTSLSYDIVDTNINFTTTLSYNFLVFADISENSNYGKYSNKINTGIYYINSPTNFTVSQSSTDSNYVTANVAWTAPSTIYGTQSNYSITYFTSTNVSPYVNTTTVSSSTTSVSISAGIVKGTTVYFIVSPSIIEASNNPTISYEQAVTLYYTNAPASLSIAQSTSLTQATLTWTVPGAYLGTINNYYYGYSVSSGTGITYSNTGSGSTYTGTITGLTISGSYYFYALATISNIGVSGPYIQSSQYTMYYVNAPTGLTVVHKTDASGVSYLKTVTFSWTASSNNGGTITYFWSCSGPTYLYSGNTTGTSVDISNLTTGSTNTFGVYAQTSNITSYSTTTTTSSTTLGTFTGYTTTGISSGYISYYTNISGSLTCNNSPLSGFTIIVGGGGSGSSSNGGVGGGGGGAGTVAYGVLQYSANSSYSIVIGSGGAGRSGASNGVTGGDTTISGGTVTTINIVAYGGGYGARANSGGIGGSGGGAGSSAAGGDIRSGTNNSVNNGSIIFLDNSGGGAISGNGGGGGGAGGVGAGGSAAGGGAGGAGGAGFNFPKFGGYYSGGGGGTAGIGGSAANGGSGVGGNGIVGAGTAGSGAANTGSGGGAISSNGGGNYSGSGADGVVVIGLVNS